MKHVTEISIVDYCIKPGTQLDLVQWPTVIKPFYDSKESYKERLKAGIKQLTKLQRLLYAHNRYSLLLIFQAMDAAGKDSAIQHVMSGVNPQGCQVYSFKHPSETELEHDFLWRTHRALPERGRIGIFNRSYYEEVLIVRVRPEVLKAQNLPDSSLNVNDFWAQRYRSIVESEAHLYRNGTRIIKFFLHLSREEQRQRFLARIDDPDKNWKFSDADMEQRQAWDQYMAAYEACLTATSTAEAPWYVVPADDKKNARLIISQIILDTLSDLELCYPPTSKARHKQLLAFRHQLEQDEYEEVHQNRKLPNVNMPEQS
ncbi:ADP-polyphosphate phosphotransferase [Nitrosomonas sp. Nm58]|uniref:ADP-polyphosphate phosphotransferase n=1 Tax=Nitrosomonas sp. Nm58 TaxID=200126 RepID=UPI00089C5F96|nr:ADP-polyphosphate phosphotransferase [Nitrosomonas sp. Nm58]SDY98742.1 polyphosphate:nucleotide phosphotransferase, PPK2 family [Nitrosomonas sp. Nm58]